ncbi:MAG: hypothetical protein J6B34_05620 [Clostridia bacterium]|nr:hypothetical protein [Clostridia bacterium]
METESRDTVKEISISEKTTAKYELLLCEDGYTIKCTETDKLTGKSDTYSARSVTTKQERAIEIFNLLVKNKACGCTMCEIISDLIC